MPRAVVAAHPPEAPEIRAQACRGGPRDAGRDVRVSGAIDTSSGASRGSSAGRRRRAELQAQLAAAEAGLLDALTRRADILEQPAPPSPRCPEKAFQKTLVDYAHLLGWVVWHDNDSRWNDAGLPDLLLIRGDRCVFAELKSARGRLEPEQCVWAVLLTRCAAVEWFLWRPYPEDWAEIERVLA